jgi:hypothetical protein
LVIMYTAPSANAPIAALIMHNVGPICGEREFGNTKLRRRERDCSRRWWCRWWA